MTDDSRPIPATESIGAYMHCSKCFPDRPDGIAPRDWAKLSVGWTELGFQVWCNRCNVNVVHVDFEGCKHPANVSPVEIER